MTPRVLPVRLLISNVFLVQQDRTIVVDSGCPGNGRTILQRLARHGIQPHEVSLILLTHGHLDHFGSAVELKEMTGAPIAIHPADAAALRNGKNPPLHPSCWLGRKMQSYFERQTCAPFEPDLLIDENTRLDLFGVSGHVVATPGHTAGSVSVFIEGGELIAGDLLMGGMLGGYLQAREPELTYFIDDLPQNLASIQAILDLPIQTVYTGHGGPLDVNQIRRRFASPAKSVAVQPKS